MAYTLITALLSIFLGTTWICRYYFGIRLFDIVYWLYSDTKVGAFIHRKMIQAYDDKEAHSQTVVTNHESYSVVSIPFMSDNYAYILIDNKSGFCAIVDPADSKKCENEWKRIKQEYLENRGLKLTLKSILTTHKHYDHAGGNAQMVSLFPDITIYGGIIDNVDSATEQCWHDTMITLGNLHIKVHAAPCHTKGHVLYQVLSPEDSEDPNCVFTGDTLFIGGAGKFFEGTGEQMYRNMYQILGEMPPSTQVFCGHEYTLDNLKFAIFIEPENTKITEKMEWTLKQRESRLPTVPSTIKDEQDYNPFMRVHVPTVSAKVIGSKTPGEVMSGIRKLKDQGVHKK